MRTIYLSIALSASLLAGCASSSLLSKEKSSQVYVGSPMVKDHVEGILQRVEIVDPSVTTTDAVGAGLGASSGGVLKGVGAVLSVASLLSTPIGTQTYVLYLTDKDGVTTKTKPYGPIKSRKFEVNHKYRVFTLQDDSYVFLDLTKTPAWEERTGPRAAPSKDKDGGAAM